MSQFFQLHPENPQPRLIAKAVELLQAGGVIAYPTDSGYALGCRLGDKTAMETIVAIRRLGDKHNFTLVCAGLSQVSAYAKVDNQAFRLISALTPGPYTFILQATHEVPRRLQNPRRKTIGIRIPDNRIAQALVQALGEPLVSSSLILPTEEMVLTDPEEIREHLERQLALVIDGGYCGHEPTTVVDLTEGVPTVVRKGRGDTRLFEE